MSLYVTDTHALLWYATGHTRRLGAAAKRAFTRAEQGRSAIYVPALVLIEILEHARLGSIRLRPTPERWVAALFASGSFHFAPLTLEVALRSAELFDIPERGDRLIAATALCLGLPLLTRDAAIVGVDTVW